MLRRRDLDDDLAGLLLRRRTKSPPVRARTLALTAAPLRKTGEGDGNAE